MNRGPAIGIGVGVAIVAIVITVYAVSGGGNADEINGNQPELQENPNGEESTGEGQRFHVTLEDGVGTTDIP